jgi:membrane protease YdiL (CAAX protease family)
LIKPDGTAFFFFALTSAGLAFSFLQGQGFNTPTAFAQVVIIILMVFGLVGWLFAEKFEKHPSMMVATSSNDREKLNIAIGVVLALFLFILSNKFIPALGVAGASTVSVFTFFGTFNFSTATLGAQTNAFMFSVIQVPTGEENFFRGFWANLSIAKAGKFAGIIFQAAIFMLFHIPAYGWGIVLGVLFADGLIIGAIDEETGRLSTGILAHVGNNFLAYMVVSASVVAGSPLFLGVTSGQLLSLPLMLGIYGFVRFRHGKPMIPFSVLRRV